jgi:ankyrin repeat protein
MTLVQFIRETKKWSGAREKQLRNYVTKHPQSVQEASAEGASTPLIAAIEQKAPLSIIMYLVQMGGMNKGSPLSEAVQHENSLPVIKYLYTQNEDAIGDRTGGSLNYGWTPLMLAVSDGFKEPSPFEVISFLVENDNGQEHMSNTGLTPLHIAFNSGLDSEIIQYLILSFPQYVKERLDEFRELPVHLMDMMGRGHGDEDKRNLASLLFRAQIETDKGIFALTMPNPNHRGVVQRIQRVGVFGASFLSFVALWVT